MTKRQRELLGVIYKTFGSGQFTVHDCSKVVKQAETGVGYYLKLYVDRGIMSFERFSSKPGIYAITVTPETHPDCFPAQAAHSSSAGWSSGAPIAAAGTARPPVAV